MPENRQVTLYQPVTPATWDLITRLAPSFYQSRLFNVSSPEQAAMVMLKGHELGLGLAASFEFIHVVEGKPSLSPRGALALVEASGLLESMEINDGDSFCEVTMKRLNGPKYSTSFGYADAKKAGLIKPRGAWDTYGPNMCRWRAIGFVIDVLFSDVTGGLKRSDEFGAEVDEAGDVVTVDPARSYVSTTELYDLVEKHGPELVFEVNGGKVPSTDEEIRYVSERLAQLDQTSH